MKTPTRLASLLIVFGTFQFSIAQVPKFSWDARWGNTEFDFAPELVTDMNGNVYCAGAFKGTVDFDPGPNQATLTSGFGGFGTDTYISKFDSSGSFLWVKQVGGVSFARAIAYDPAGFISIGGDFGAEADFDPGTGVSNVTPANNSSDLYLLKLDLDGNFISAKTFGGNGQDYLGCMSMDGDGSFALAGLFTGTSDFDPGPGETIFTAEGLADLFILRLSADGDFIWAKEFSGSFQGDINGVDFDDDGNIYVAGIFDDVRDFDPGIDEVTLTATGYWDAFVVKLNAAGEFEWIRPLSNGGENWVQDLFVSEDQSIYITGYFSATMDFDPGSDTFRLTAQNTDPYIWKLDVNGDFIWVRQFEGVSFDQSRAITTDVQGNIYSTGWFGDVVDFDPGPGEHTLISTGQNDMDDGYITKLTGDGNFVWAYALGGLGNDNGTESHIDIFGNIFITGYFRDKAGFYPGNHGGDSLISAGGSDAFLVRWRQSACPEVTVSLFEETLIAGQDGSYQWVDCNNGYAHISGETGSSFSPPFSGDYAVIIGNGECTDTSDCVNVMIVSTERTDDRDPFIYPNPSSRQWYVDLRDVNTQALIEIMDISGRVVFHTQSDGSPLLPLHIALAAGVYSVHVVSHERSYILKAVRTE